MQLLSKDMAKILASNTRSKNVDTAEVAEDLKSLRGIAVKVLAKLAGVDIDLEEVRTGGIIMERPVEVKTKGTLTQNRANLFRKAATVAGLEEKVHYTVSRSSPADDVLKKRMAMSQEELDGLVYPHNTAPWGWILINFTDDGLAELGTWGETQEAVADGVTEELEAYQGRRAVVEAERVATEPAEGEVVESGTGKGAKRS